MLLFPLMKDHERVLKEIAEDREKKKMTNQTPETVTKDTPGPVAGPSAGSHPKQTPDRCQIQVRNQVYFTFKSNTWRVKWVWILFKFQANICLFSVALTSNV